MKNKEFDCVKMKSDIQQEIRREFAGVPEAEARDRQMRQVAQDTILGRLYRRLSAERESANTR